MTTISDPECLTNYMYSSFKVGFLLIDNGLLCYVCPGNTASLGTGQFTSKKIFGTFMCSQLCRVSNISGDVVMYTRCDHALFSWVSGRAESAQRMANVYSDQCSIHVYTLTKLNTIDFWSATTDPVYWILCIIPSAIFHKIYLGLFFHKWRRNVMKFYSKCGNYKCSE